MLSRRDFIKQILIGAEVALSPTAFADDREPSMEELDKNDLASRVDILKKMAQSNSIVLPDDVALYIAMKHKEHKEGIRDMEGALITVSSFSTLAEKDISLKMARWVLRDRQIDW